MRFIITMNREQIMNNIISSGNSFRRSLLHGAMLLTASLLFMNDAMACMTQHACANTAGKGQRIVGNLTHEINNAASEPLDTWFYADVEIPLVRATGTQQGSDDWQYYCDGGKRNKAQPCIALHTNIFRMSDGVDKNNVRVTATVTQKTAEITGPNGGHIELGAYFTGGDPTLRYENANKNSSGIVIADLEATGLGGYLATDAGYKSVTITTDVNGKELVGSFPCGDTRPEQCQQTDTFYFIDKNSNSKLRLALKLKSDSFKDTRYDFSNVPILSLTGRTITRDGYADHEGTVDVKISGSISIPNRCYIQNANATTTWNVGDVSAVRKDGDIDSRTLELRTTCTGIKANITQFIYVERDDTVNASQDQKHVLLARDESDKKDALFLIMNIFDATQGTNTGLKCNGVNLFEFNKWHKRNTKNTALNNGGYSTVDMINFALCKDGTISTSGDLNKKAVIKVKSRWQITDVQ